MKHLIDTCGWIEWLINDDLADSYAPFLADLKNLIVPVLVQYELYKWVCREKNSTTALEVIGITENAHVIPLDTSLALLAADLAKECNLAMADAIIYATSCHYNALLVTSDAHFKNLKQVKYIEKSCSQQAK